MKDDDKAHHTILRWGIQEHDGGQDAVGTHYIEAVYNGKSARPISFEVEYRINNGEWQEKKFKNMKEKKEW